MSEYQRAYANQIRECIRGDYLTLGTDGYGRSDSRENLRDFFEINSEHIVFNALKMLGKNTEAKEFMKKANIKSNLEAPWKR